MLIRCKHFTITMPKGQFVVEINPQIEATVKEYPQWVALLS